MILCLPDPLGEQEMQSVCSLQQTRSSCEASLGSRTGGRNFFSRPQNVPRTQDEVRIGEHDSQITEPIVAVAHEPLRQGSLTYESSSLGWRFYFEQLGERFIVSGVVNRNDASLTCLVNGN